MSAKKRVKPTSAKSRTARAAAAEEEIERKRQEHAAAREWLASLAPSDILTKDIFDSKCVAALKTEFAANTPFPHAAIENFVDTQFLTAMLNELKNLEYVDKSNDLYTFAQSRDDLKSVTFPLVERFRDLLYSPAVVSALSEVTGIELYGLDRTPQPDIFAAVYSDKSRLLCHDDELEGRRIAYICYLTEPGWEEADGGHLDLFGTDPATGQPSGVVKSCLPKWASFLFFEVSPKSYHQVREVLAKSKLRVSVGGWFHGPPITRPAQTVEPLAPARTLVPPPAAPELQEAITAASLASAGVPKWVSKQYCGSDRMLTQIEDAFTNDSSLELHNVLPDAVFRAVVKELGELETFAFGAADAAATAAAGEGAKGVQSHPLLTAPAQGSGITLAGPANYRCYYDVSCAGSAAAAGQSGASTIPAPASAAPEGGRPATPTLEALVEFLGSDGFAHLIARMTGMASSAATLPSVRLFRRGCYTLAHDGDAETRAEGLDVVVTIMDPRAGLRWKEADGGSQHYLLAGKDEELLTVNPVPNALSLVYREPTPEGEEGGVLQFTRYVAHTAPGSVLQIRLTFRELDGGEDDLDEDEDEGEGDEEEEDE